MTMKSEAIIVMYMEMLDLNYPELRIVYKPEAVSIALTHHCLQILYINLIH